MESRIEPKERELLENEVKLDNVLHKIGACARRIRELRADISSNAGGDMNESGLDAIDELAQTIVELSAYAAILDEQDERITQDLESNIRGALDDAITKILAVRNGA